MSLQTPNDDGAAAIDDPLTDLLVGQIDMMLPPFDIAPQHINAAN
ncbi:hypothetical protein J2W30_006417 [Variovorax boronicumulans]|nr:hypothetical protein [Variovorax boronicumulans]MDP9995245.1 hypothetical protein [Variovorax boronicumulans]MDQ0006535.1 hypothetical protein [Variovorax boronicumulans]MDQ0038630.1 hypothetical protein [Variovorax boronicumulans]